LHLGQKRRCFCEQRLFCFAGSSRVVSAAPRAFAQERRKAWNLQHHEIGANQVVGWGGRIRTFTILINSEVSYRLDHAPAALRPGLRPEQTR
jgi:hypothetical protein